MTLSEAVTIYKQLKTASAITPIHAEEINFFNKVATIRLIGNDEVVDYFTATLLFSEMSIRKIGDLSPLYAYYYGSVCQNEPITEKMKIDARRLRLISLCVNMAKCERLITFAYNVPLMGYKGNLSEEEFFDFLIMSDAYLVWDSDNESQTLKSIQKKVIQHEANHPTWNKKMIIKEGNIAHSALLATVKCALRIR